MLSCHVGPASQTNRRRTQLNLEERARVLTGKESLVGRLEELKSWREVQCSCTSAEIRNLERMKGLYCYTSWSEQTRPPFREFK